MRRHKCQAHPDQMVAYNESCLKCRNETLAAQLALKDQNITALTGSPQTVLGVSYPADRLFEKILQALKFQRARRGVNVDVRIGRDYGNEATYVVPQSVAYALHDTWSGVDPGFTALEEEAIDRAIENASNKIAWQVRDVLSIKFRAVKIKMLEEFRNEQSWKAAQTEREAKRSAEKSLPLLADFAWSTRARRALRDLGVHTTEELLTRTAADIAAARNCGKRTQTEIGGKLAAHGLALQKGKE
jgi:hypothetical protein